MTNTRQHLTAAAVGVALFYTGCVYGWIPAMIVKLEGEDSELPMTSSESSWAVVLTHAGSLLTAVPGGLLSARLGRKPVILASAPLCLICWMIAMLTRSVPLLFCIRVLQGMGMGMVFSCAPVFIGEMAEPKIRGTLGVLVGSMWGLGLVYQYALSPFLGYSASIWVNVPFPIIFMLIFFWIPDSPYSLLMRGKHAAASHALAWFRGVSEGESIAEELKMMKESVYRELQNKASYRDLIGTPEGRRSLGIMMLVISTLVLGGMMSVLVYAGQSLTRAAGPNSAAARAGPVIVSLVSLAGPLLVGFSVDRLGRRPLLLTSFFGASLCLLGSGTYYYLHHIQHEHAEHISWLSYVSLILTAFFQGIVSGLSFPLRAELFSSSTRGIAAGLVSSTITVTSFTSIKLFQVIKDSFGLYVNFYIYCVLNLMGAILIYFVVPETKGRTFDQIQQILSRKH